MMPECFSKKCADSKMDKCNKVKCQGDTPVLSNDLCPFIELEPLGNRHLLTENAFELLASSSSHDDLYAFITSNWDL